MKMPLRVLGDSSLPSFVAGFIAVLTGFASSMALIFQAGKNAGLSDAQIASWIWALSLGIAISCIGLSLRYRAPVVIAWSTPGAALLISSLKEVPYAEAIGAYIVASLLIVVCGLTRTFDVFMRRVPQSIAAALLAGVLFKIGLEICGAAEVQPLLVVTMFLGYLLGKRFLPRYAVLIALLTGVTVAALQGLLDFSQVELTPASPVWTTPAFSLSATISIALPLFIVAMTSQNLPGMTIINANGYDIPASPILTTTGLASALTAPFGGHGISLAAISAAICAGPEAGPDPKKRYTAVIWCGVFYAIAGVFATTVATLFAGFPSALILSIAALALFSSIIAGLAQAMAIAAEREAALITFLVTASGMTLFSVGSAFWGVVAGLIALLILNTGKRLG